MATMLKFAPDRGPPERERLPLATPGPLGDMAAKSGVSIATIKRLEAQDGPIGGRLDTVGKIVSALGSKPNQLDRFRRIADIETAAVDASVGRIERLRG